MCYELNEDTLHHTTKCPREKRCLKRGGGPECEVDRIVEDGGVFLHSVKPEPCVYKMSFGYEYICHCPIRYELFDRFGV